MRWWGWWVRVVGVVGEGGGAVVGEGGGCGG